MQANFWDKTLVEHVLHVVPHTHWDREWYLPFQTFRIKLVHLIDGLLELLRDPDYPAFTLDGQTIVLDDYLRVRPEREDELRAHIQAGRILIGPWTVLPDEFLVSPESLVRNLLHGRRRAADFGPRMDVGYVPDPFGHVGQLPQILRGFGIDAAVFWRGLGAERPELEWEAPDGSRVFVGYLRQSYSNAAHIPDDPAGLALVAARLRDALAGESQAQSLLLMNGTDHMEPRPGLGKLLRETRVPGARLEASTLPRFLEAVRKELAERNAELPVVRGELRDPSRQHLLPGVLSSRSWIKQQNHACETLLERVVEPLVAFARLHRPDAEPGVAGTGHLPTPRVADADALVREAWRILLECHPHDSICGCSIDAVHREMGPRFEQVEQIGEELLRQSGVALVDAVDTAELAVHGCETALVVLNLADAERADVVRFRLRLPPAIQNPEVVDEHGRVLPARLYGVQAERLGELALDAQQMEGMLGTIADGTVLDQPILGVTFRTDADPVGIDLVVGRGRRPDPAIVEPGVARIRELLAARPAPRFVVTVRLAAKVDLEIASPEIPGHGLVALGVREATRPAGEITRDDGRTLENEALRVELEDDGRVSLLDRATGARFHGLLGLRDVAECGDSYNFTPLAGDRPIERTRLVGPVAREVGPTGGSLVFERVLRVPAALDADRTRRSPELVDLRVQTELRLSPGARRVDVALDVENRARDHRLQLLAPLGGALFEASYDGHYEIVRRSTEPERGGPDWAEQPRPEKPVRNFVAGERPGGAAGLLLAQRGLREASAEPDGTLVLTLLRCFGWLSRDDLSNRRGGAGPTLETPEGQELGLQRFELSLAPFSGAADFVRAQHEAQAFQTPARAFGTRVGPGTLPARASLLAIDPDRSPFVITAVKRAETGDGLVVRGVNTGADPVEVRISLRAPGALRVHHARIDETALEAIRPGPQNEVTLELPPARIATLLFRP